MDYKNDVQKGRCGLYYRMNLYELAKLQYYWRRDTLAASRKRVAERKKRIAAEKLEAQNKGRNMKDAIITVVVALPSGDIKMTFTKRDIFANVPKQKLTEREFRNCFKEALKPIMGAVE